MDNILFLRDGSSNLTGDETLTDMELTPQNTPVYLHILVPSVSSGDVLDVTADFEDASGNTLQQTTIPQIAAAGKFVIPIFCDHPSVTDLSVILNVTANATTGTSFGGVKVWVSTSRKS